ncbi:Phosphatidylinositol 3; 4; 5-trisphosphate 3-phosphatase TPTE2 [Camelus dromedarius]|uniref:Phosphatidylinositol 3 n=1 Tax=Camelus dromedarius TaxID=9838 RepID=A0A5N4D911_CAMDR|nr:Phosphatidylinositol 3; 4; 5-trisphosphate 3-phosphatase TPTE2 [Camelus dromedarius]
MKNKDSYEWWFTTTNRSSQKSSERKYKEEKDKVREQKKKIKEKKEEAHQKTSKAPPSRKGSFCGSRKKNGEEEARRKKKRKTKKKKKEEGEGEEKEEKNGREKERKDERYEGRSNKNNWSQYGPQTGSRSIAEGKKKSTSGPTLDLLNQNGSFSFIVRLTVFTRPLRLFVLLRAVHLAHQERHLEALTRRMVSENKRRYRKDGFDLDLTYVTDHYLKGVSIQNQIQEVMRFLDTKHANHYQVYNLCSEKAYDPEYFHHRVRQYMIDDHNVPSLIEMLAFSRDVEKWMAQDEENIIVVHCKGGKGRTGTMICAYLLASERFTTAEDSLYYFGERRTDKSTSNKYQGVETPSQTSLVLQSRFVGYFAKVKNTYNLHLPPRKILKINKFVIYSIHGVGKGDGSDLEVQIMMKRKTVFFCSASRYCKIVHDAESNRVIINIFNSPLLYDEVKVRFLSSALPRYYDNCPFYFWFHTSFIQDNRYDYDLIQ